MTSGADVNRGAAGAAASDGLKYRRDLIEVDGGHLTVGTWGDETAHPVIALHGVTGNHLCWAFVAQAMPEVRILAPDLRGRGGSSLLAGPYGMARHAEDLIKVMDHYGIDRAVVLGHSMGAFVGLVAADRYVERVSSLVMVDGGMPMPPPPIHTPPGFPDPVVFRLNLTFPDEASAIGFWRTHPAVAGHFTKEFEEYARYDLGGFPPAIHSRSTPESVVADADDLRHTSVADDALGRLAVPTQWMTAPRGLLDEAPGLYPPSAVVHWGERYPHVEIHPTHGFNHYTIVLSQRGGQVVSEAVRRAMTGEVRTHGRSDLDVVIDPARGRIGLRRHDTPRPPRQVMPGRPVGP